MQLHECSVCCCMGARSCGCPRKQQKGHQEAGDQALPPRSKTATSLPSGLSACQQ